MIQWGGEGKSCGEGGLGKARRKRGLYRHSYYVFYINKLHCQIDFYIEYLILKFFTNTNIVTLAKASVLKRDAPIYVEKILASVRPSRPSVLGNLRPSVGYHFWRSVLEVLGRTFLGENLGSHCPRVPPATR